MSFDQMIQELEAIRAQKAHPALKRPAIKVSAKPKTMIKAAPVPPLPVGHELELLKLKLRHMRAGT